MAMNKKTVFAAFFVACLMIASLGALTVSTTSEGSSTHYTDIDKQLYFSTEPSEQAPEMTEGKYSAKIINKAVGSEVCYFEDEINTLIFTASCSLRYTGTEPYFMMFSDDTVENSAIYVEADVTVNITAGESFDQSGEEFAIIFADKALDIQGEGTLHLALVDPKVPYSAAIYIDESRPSFMSTVDELIILAPNYTCLAMDGSGDLATIIIDGKVSMEGKYAITVGSFDDRCVVNMKIEEGSTVKFSGTEAAFNVYGINIKHDKVNLYASMSWRATDLKDFDNSKALQYQYVTSEQMQVNGLLIPLVIVLIIACVLLFGYVFLYNPRPPWEQEKINAEKAKIKAEKEAKRLEMEKKKALERAELEKKRAAEAKAKEEARKVAEAKKAEERRLREEQKAKERAELEKKRAAEAKAKEEARKAAEAKKAEERRLAEERKAKEAAERKAAEAKRAAEKKAAAERKAEEEKARKAIKAKEAAEAKQREEAKKAEKAKKEAAKKKK